MNRIGITFGVGMENTVAMADINLRAIAENLTRHGIEIDQNVMNMMETYGRTPIDDPFYAENYTRNFISATYNFIMALLSGYYMLFDIFLPLFRKDVDSPIFNNGYVRNINWKGGTT